eukprot:scaffold77893_cov40-Cyclotella_meneghiniana.AAC.3
MSSPSSSGENNCPLSADELKLLSTALQHRGLSIKLKEQQPHEYLSSLIEIERSNGSVSVSASLSHLIVANTDEALPLVQGKPTMDKLLPLFSSILEKLALLDHDTQANLINNLPHFQPGSVSTKQPGFVSTIPPAVPNTVSGTARSKSTSLKTPPPTNDQQVALDSIWNKISEEHRPAPSPQDMNILRKLG